MIANEPSRTFTNRKALQFLHVDLMTRRPPSSWAGAFSKLAGINEGIRRVGEPAIPRFGYVMLRRAAVGKKRLD